MNRVLELAKNAAELAKADAPACPRTPRLQAKYHGPDACLSKPSRPLEGDADRGRIYRRLKDGGRGATLVPNEATVTCPSSSASLSSLESSSSGTGGLPSEQGFDTTWIVENTSTKPAVLAWVVNGVEYSPFAPGVSPMDDPRAMLQPGDWISVPTFESFVYHVRAFDEDDGIGDIVLQHRAGMVPLGGKFAKPNAPKKIDAEPFDKTLEHQKQEAGRKPTHRRPCNVVDVGFRNEAGFPLSVYWAANLGEPPLHGFTCAERYQFHMGTKDATQDFMWDWGSKTKYEGSFIGHTFVARKADDPNIVIDTYTLEPTRIIDCPRNKQQQVIEVLAEVGAAEDIGESCPNNNRDGTGDDDEDEDSNGGGGEGAAIGIVPPGLPPRPGATGFAGTS